MIPNGCACNARRSCGPRTARDSVAAGGRTVALKDFTLLAKLEELDVMTHNIVKKFEKSERHVLSAEIRNTIADIEHAVIRATKKQLAERKRRVRPEKTLAVLCDADVELEYLKLQIRKAFALRLINEKCYGDWSRMVLEVGGLLGAWLKKLDTEVNAVAADGGSHNGPGRPQQSRLL